MVDVGKGKNKQRKQQKRKQRKRDDPGSPVAAAPFPYESEGTSRLRARQLPERSHAPVFLDPHGRPRENPYEILGLEVDERDAQRIRAASRDRLLEHPPEQDPDTAAAILRAREELLDARYVLHREWGVLHPPDPSKWGLVPPQRDAGPVVPAESERRLPAADRLLGQLLVYAFLEDECSEKSPDKGPPPNLFDS